MQTWLAVQLSMDKEKWLDQYGLLHPHPQPSDSINGIIFIAQYYLFKYLLGELTDEDVLNWSVTVKAHEIKEGVYAQTPWSKQDPSSHDNDTAIRALSYLLDLEPKKGRIAGYFWHPRDIIFYNFCAGGWRKWLIGKPLMWLVAIIQYISCKQVYKIRGGAKREKTDGKLLSFMRFMCTKKDCWTMRMNYKTCEKALSKHKDLKLEMPMSTWLECFQHYHRTQDHPVKVIAERYFNKA